MAGAPFDRWFVFGMALGLCALAGCIQHFPFRPHDAWREVQTIEGLDLGTQSTSPPMTLGDAEGQSPHPTPAGELPLPYEGSNNSSPVEELAVEAADAVPQTIELKLEDARMAALQNNLELQVQLIAPAIAQERVDEQAARFQAMLTGGLGRSSIDPPPGNVSFGAQQPQVIDGFNPFSRFSFINPALTAIDVPLTTGGRVSLDTGLTRLERSDIDSTYDTHLGFSFSQPLLRGAGKNVNTAGIRIAELNNGIAQARTKLAVIRVLADVERAYWQLYRAEMTNQVARRQLDIAHHQLRIADRLIEADVLSRVDRLRAESGLYSREVALITSRTEVLIAARELKRIMQRDELPVDGRDQLVIATDPLPLGIKLDRRVLTERAIAERAEMFEIELQLMTDALNISVEENGVLPRLDGVARYTLLGSDGNLGNSYDRLFGDGFNDWFVGVIGQVPLPLGSGNQAAAARRQQAVLSQLQNSISRVRLEVIIRRDVHNAVDRLEQSWQRILAARQAVLAAEKTYQAEQRLFEQGQRDSTDVLFAAGRLATVQIDEISALVDFELAKIDLAVATGSMLGFGQVDWQTAGSIR